MQNKTTNSSTQKNTEELPTSMEQREKLHTLRNTDTEIKESYPLLTREPIEGTPFWITGNEEIGYKITWGKYNFNNEPLKSQEEAMQWLADHTWDIVLNLIAIGLKLYEETKDGSNLPKN